MDKQITQDEAITNLIRGTAPERELEFLDLWKNYSPQIEQSDDKEGFTLETIASYGIINFNHKSLVKIWLLGFSMQKAFHAYSPFIILAIAKKWSLSSDEFTFDKTAKESISESQSILHKIDELISLSSIEQFEWPNGVPEPVGKPSDCDGSMVFDLLCMSAAYNFLHEFKHIMFNESGVSISNHEEEMKCDEFARTFILEKIDEYSISSGYDLNNLKSKRAMSLAISSILLYFLTPRDNWSGTQSHPSIRSRVNGFIEYLDLPENDSFWLYFSCALLSILEFNSIIFTCNDVTSQKNFCIFLLDELSGACGHGVRRVE